MTVIGCILFADWQAIPYDPCTEYSPFHHPEITQNYSIKQSLNETSKKSYEKLSMTTGSVQSLQVLSNFSYHTAKINCIHANFTNHHCHWSPSSVITKKECEDCQLICKSIEQSLTFVQYVLGTALIFSSITVTWVPITVLASYQALIELQVQ